MFRRLLLTSFLALLSLPAFAVTPITVSGTTQVINTQASGTGVFVRFRLRNYAGFVPKVFGTGIIVQAQLDVTPVGVGGTFATPLWSNDDIVPNTCGVTANQACTWYTVEFWAGGRITSSGNYCIPNTSPTYDLNVAVPCQTPPLPPGPIQVTNVSGGTLSGTTTHVLKFIGPTTASDSEGTASGTAAAVWPLGLNVGSASVQIQKQNSSSPGTTQFLLASKDPATGFARNAQVTDNNSLIGITVTGAGTTGLASIVIAGSVPCTFDNQSGIGDWVVLGSSSQCHDAGTTQPIGVMSIAKVASVNSGTGTNATVDLGLPDVTSNTAATSTGGNGTVSPCATNGAVGFYSAIGNTIGCDSLFTDDGAGNLHATSFLLNGTGGGFLFFGQGATPTLSQTNAVYFYAPASVPTSFGTAWPSTPGTNGQTLVITSVPDSTHIVLGYATSACTGACLGTVPVADQTITGSFQLINLGTGQTGPAISTFDANIQGQAFNPASGQVAISGQNKNASTTSGASAGLQGLGQGFAAFGVWGVASNTVTNTVDFPNGGDFQAFLTCSLTCGGGPLGNAAAGLGSPAVGTTMGLASGYRGQASNLGLGTIAVMQGFEARANTNTGGGTVTGNFGFNVVQAQTVGTLNAAFHAADQGAAGNQYGIYFEGSTHNYMGGGQTLVGSLGLGNVTGSTQCLQADSSGAVTGTAASCAGTSSPGGINTNLQYNNAGAFGGFTDGTSTQVLHGGRTFGSVVNADIAAATIDLTAKVTGVLPTANGGLNNGFFAVSGPATSTKTFTFPNANATVLTSNAAVTVAQGGTGLTAGTSGGILAYTASGVLASSAALTASSPVLGGGAGVVPSTVAGITSDGVSQFTLGVAGSSVGGINFKNATSGTLSLQPATGALGAVTVTIPAVSGPLTETIASGTSALGTGAISSATCATVVTTSATGTLTTDVIVADFNADPTGVTGYNATGAGPLTIYKYPTANNVNYKVCNWTAGSITPGAITLNWRVVR